MAHTLDLFSSTETLYIQTTSVHLLSMDVTRVLWQNILWHIHTNGIGRTSKVVNGLSHFSSETDLDGFDV